MRIAALILGIISSVLGLVSSISFVTGLQLTTNNKFILGGIIEVNKDIMLGLSWLSVALFAIGLVHSCLVMSRPKKSGDIMVAVSIVGLVFTVGTSFIYVMYGLLLISGIIAYKGAREIEPQHEDEKMGEKDISLFKMLLNPKKYKV